MGRGSANIVVESDPENERAFFIEHDSDENDDSHDGDADGDWFLKWGKTQVVVLM